MAAFLKKTFGGTTSGGSEDDHVDMTYITPRVIAMSNPSSGHSFVGGQNNPLDKVAARMNEAHKGCFMVWNLSEKAYDYDHFDGATVLDNYGWGTGLAPPLAVLFAICQSMETWLQADPKNVCLVHSDNGKGRTGTAIASFLVYCKFHKDSFNAIKHFGQSRKGGILTPSQRRYVKYMNDVLVGMVNPVSSPLILRRMILTPVPKCEKDGSAHIAVEILCGDDRTCIFSNLKKSRTQGSLTPAVPFRDSRLSSMFGLGSASETPITQSFEGSVIVDFGSLVVSDDLVINIYHFNRVHGRSLIGRVCCNAAFMPKNGILKVDKSGIDFACNDQKVFLNDSCVHFAFSMPLTAQEEHLVSQRVMETRTNSRTQSRWKGILETLKSHSFGAELSGLNDMYDVSQFEPVEFDTMSLHPENGDEQTS